MKAFNKTSIGYSHVKEGKPCQDFSEQYQDAERTIVTACDGHGGAIYIRSQVGSRFASQAIITVFRSIEIGSLDRVDECVLQRIKLEVLCEWNALVERDIARRPIGDVECSLLSEDDKFRLLSNPVRAYGTTLHGAMRIKNKYFFIGIGDGGVFIVKGRDVFPLPATDEADDTVANITYSMCQEDAFDHLSVSMIDADDADAVLVVTDGMVNPYRNVKGFGEYFVMPVLSSLEKGRKDEVSTFVERLGKEIGIGDDVSLSVLYQEMPKE